MSAAQERLTYTVPEAAQLLGISERLLRELVRSGHVPVIRLGHRVLVSRAVLAQIAAGGHPVPAQDESPASRGPRLVRETGS